MNRIDQIESQGDGLYRVRFWMTAEEARRADTELGAWAREVATIERTLGVEVPAYPSNRKEWSDHYWQVLEPIYRRRFEAYRWQQ